MSLADIRPYFRTHMNALNFKEWKDAFNVENIPSTLLERAYHLESGQVRVLGNNQHGPVVSQDITIRFWIKGLNDMQSGLDNAYKAIDLVMAEMLVAKNRLAEGSGVTNVELSGIQPPQEIQHTNSKIIVVEMLFSALTIYGF